MAYAVNFRAIYPLTFDGFTVPGYAALYALAVNLAVAALLTVVFNALGVRSGKDATEPHHYRV
jgi:SSS family solute:Na+ symporter